MIVACWSCARKAVPTTPATTSGDILIAFLDAFDARDGKALLPLVSGGNRPQELFRAMLDTAIATDEFRERLTEAYGHNAWNNFQAEVPLGENRPDMNFTIPDTASLREAAEGWQATSDNRGECDILPRLAITIRKFEGGWLIDGAALFDDPEILKGHTDTQRKLTKYIRRYFKAIGHPGISAEDIDYQMGRDLMTNVFGLGEFRVDGKPAHPDRFDIDSF